MTPHMTEDRRAAAPRQMHLTVFMYYCGNYHFAGWRLPGAYADAAQNFSRWADCARTMERGKLDMIFVGDIISPQGVDDPQTMSRTSRTMGFEPLTLLAALSGVTTHLGLAGTVATTWNEPYMVARMLASLDHLSNGRAAWNVVTGRNPEDARNFSLDKHFDHEDRYERAEEFVDVVRGLWDTYEDDALLHDKENGRFFDPEKFHLLNHTGKRFSVRGPLSVARPPQGHPVIIQAGNSEPAKELSARVAEMVFTEHNTLEAARAYYSDVKGRMAKYGRNPDNLRIICGMTPYVGRTMEEAQAKFDRLQAMMPAELVIKQFSIMIGTDVSGYPLDGPMPKVDVSASRSNPEQFLSFGRGKNLTLLQTALRATAAKSHLLAIGTAEDVADQMQQWFEGGAADGFNLLLPSMPGDLDDFVDLVVPVLQKRGLFRTEYASGNLREMLGLPRPPNALAIRDRELKKNV